MAKRPHNRAIAAMIDAFDGGDPWGSAMSMAFAVAEVSEAVGFDKPGEVLEYHRSPIVAIPALEDLADDEAGESWETRELAKAVQSREVVLADLLTASRILHKYLHILRIAGEDY